MFTSIINCLRGISSTVTEALCVTTRWIAAQLRHIRRQHQALSNSNVVYSAVIATAAAWVVDSQNVMDVLLAVFTLLFGVVTVMRADKSFQTDLYREDLESYPY